VLGAILYVLLLVGLVCAGFAVREELDRIRRVKHWLAVLGEEEEGR
jgi:hypothetical protein